MRGHGTALAHLLFLAARRRPHEFGLHGCLLRSHPLTLPTAPISFNFLAVNDIGGGAGAPSPGLCQSWRVAAVDLSRRGRAALSDLPPLGSHLGAVGKAIPQQHGQLPGGQADAGRRSGGPPVEASLREAFGAEPKALAVVEQQFERGARAIAKDKDGTVQGILSQRLSTDGGESIDPFAAVDGLQGEKDATVGGELQHQASPRNARTTAASGGAASRK